MSTYQATMPPDDTTCGMRSCSARATVRTVIPPSRFEADGVDHSQDPSTFDTCVCHWPIMRAAVLGNGHEITDTTGDIEALKADYPTWSVFRSDSGRLYAAACRGTGLGITLDAWLAGQLRAQMESFLSVAQRVSAP